MIYWFITIPLVGIVICLALLAVAGLAAIVAKIIEKIKKSA